jgi:BirA family biotin operon repressor/biotin-[acetyl-CoA-carboxylase] ligase
VSAERLLHALADGHTHSGEALARDFGVTRAAIWKQVGKLADWGLAVDAVPGEGYRLARRVDLLDADALRASLSVKTLGRLASLDVFTELGSTNRHLLREPPPAGMLDVCVAEFQTDGRGRRGRRWSTPLGAGICLSVGWQFAEMPAELPALTLAVGVVVRRVLERVAGLTISLKWPNDLVFDERKLGGILLELSVEAQGGSHVVAGVGLNVELPRELLPDLCDWPRGAIDLKSALGREAPPRRKLVAALVDDLCTLFAGYAATGFAAYRGEWQSGDYLRGRAVRLDEAGGAVTGTALGIDGDGALLIETAAGARRRIVAGDVSVRQER